MSQGRNEGGMISRALYHYGGAERYQQRHNYFHQYSTFASERTLGSKMEAPNLLLALGAI